MPDVATLALVAGGLAWWWHAILARRRQRLALPQAYFAEDADIALHVAMHEAKARRQWLACEHLLHGLLQDEAVRAAIEQAGGKLEPLEDKVFAALEAIGPDAAAPVVREGLFEPSSGRVLSRAYAQAQSHGRLPTCTDLWAQLAAPPAGALIRDGGVDPVAVLYVLVHGMPDADPETALALPTRDVDVVLRNDHFTTQELVTEILRDVFDLDAAAASAKMLAAHTEGSAVLGRYSTAAARAKLAAARARARAHGFPLRIDAEPR